jgi:hypothetical protein
MKPKEDPYWRKAKLAARILLRARAGKPLTPRQKRLARQFAADPGVENRLVDQAVACVPHLGIK